MTCCPIIALKHSNRAEVVDEEDQEGAQIGAWHKHHRQSGAPLAGISQKRAGAATGPEGRGLRGVPTSPLNAAFCDFCAF